MYPEAIPYFPDNDERDAAIDPASYYGAALIFVDETGRPLAPPADLAFDGYGLPEELDLSHFIVLDDDEHLRNARRKRGPRDSENASYLHNVAVQAAEEAHSILRSTDRDGYAFTTDPDELARLLEGPLRRVMRVGQHDVGKPHVWDTAVATFVLAGASSTAWTAAIWNADRAEPIANQDYAEGVLSSKVATMVRSFALQLVSAGAFSTEPARLRQLLKGELRRRLVVDGYDVNDPVVWETAVTAFVAWGVSPLALGAAIFAS